MKITMEEIKQLREKTGAGVMEAKRALEEALSNSKLNTQTIKMIMIKAEEIIDKKGLARAESKARRATTAGVVYAYVHHDGKSGAMIKLLCETDFVAKTDDFIHLAKELAMQVTSMKPKNVKAFLAQNYVRDPKYTIDKLIKQTAGKVGENVQLSEFVRLGL